MEIFKRTSISLLLVALLVFSWLSPLDSLATKLVDAGLQRALVSFAVAKTLNGVISVVQESQLSATPGGVGVNFAIGQFLDPVNDLVEQISTLLLIASVSFGVQKVLISMGAHWLVSASLSIAVLLLSLFYFRGRAIPAWLKKVMVIAIMLRLAVPVIVVGTDFLFQNFLAADYAATQRSLEVGAVEAKKLTPSMALIPENQTLVEKMKGWVPDLNLGARLDALLKLTHDFSDHIIKLMVIFVLQTFLIPLALLWALVALTKSLLGAQSLPLPGRVTLLPSKPEPEGQ